MVLCISVAKCMKLLLKHKTFAIECYSFVNKERILWIDFEGELYEEHEWIIFGSVDNFFLYFY